LDQLKNQSEEYSNLKNELTSSESGHKNNDLKIQLKNEEDKLESIAVHLLSLRYTDDKNRLRQHIIDIAMGENYELDNASDPYVLTMGVSSRANTGNYAFEDSTLFGDTNYNHDSQNNTSGVQTTEFYLPTTANVHSGAYILTQEGSSEEPALYPDISWRALTFNGTCRTSIQEDNSTAGFNIRNIFYDVSSNTAYYHEYLRDYCTTSGQYKEFDEGPHRVTMPEMLMTANHLYYIYMDSFAESFLGSARALDGGLGTRWEAIDIIFD